MKRLNRLLNWTPELYFLMFYWLWVIEEQAQIPLLRFPEIMYSIPIALGIVFALQYFMRAKALGIFILVALIAGSLVNLFSYFSRFYEEGSGPNSWSLLVFGTMMLITNVVMLIWLAGKYRLKKAVN
ncbi:MAG: hypothetical protein EP338_04465 [Bacteroidetes bacterium]|nr:MAG: hypothetical protein EP338_04465 [Bacteroidota bacterium]